ncbi:MAG TPA: hypothetical protein VMV58_00225 [Desulfosporosinus sp.]|nr:hypothetical protein [Desulfosporosinus sp.]
MGWIAVKAQTVRRNGEYVKIKPGDPVPEAEFWPNRRMWERQKFILEVARVIEPIEPMISLVETVVTTKQNYTKKESKNLFSHIDAGSDE